jgi:hypothetical protein
MSMTWGGAVTEWNSSEGAEKLAAGLRSQLLLPVMEGNTLESEDVAEFLSLRLAAVEPIEPAAVAVFLDRGAGPASL